MKIADLFCGAGGAAMGLHRAGFEVVGFDIEPQKNYPFEFHQQDALTVDLSGFDAVWASPPCQRYSSLNKGTNRNASEKPDMIYATRGLVSSSNVPYIIENVPGSPLVKPVLICGSMFMPPMDIRRHRNFESNVVLAPPEWPCRHKLYGPRYLIRQHGEMRWSTVTWVYGHAHYSGENEQRIKAMGIDWMTNKELTQAVPPAYSEYLGEQLMRYIESQT